MSPGGASVPHRFYEWGVKSYARVVQPSFDSIFVCTNYMRLTVKSSFSRRKLGVEKENEISLHMERFSCIFLLHFANNLNLIDNFATEIRRNIMDYAIVNDENFQSK